MKKAEIRKYATPEEVIRKFKIEPMTKEESLDFLYKAGIVTKKGNLRKFYRNTNTSNPKKTA